MALRINDGEGLYDAVGLCDTLLKIADHIEVKGSANLQNLLLVINGLEKVRQHLHKIRDEEDRKSGEEVSANDNGHPSDG
mgnify:CR=1 FL=1